jgi:hypothetical protein
MLRDIGGDGAAKRHTHETTPMTGLQSVCSMDSSDEDVVLLTVAIANNYGAKMMRTRKHWVHPLTVEKVSTCGTFAVSRDLSKYPEKFQEMYRVSKESFLELCEYVRLDRLYQRKTQTIEKQYLLKNVV